MKIAMLSTFRPEQDGIAIYTDNLVAHLKKQGIRVIKIGTEKSRCDYKIDFNSFKLKTQLKKIIEKEKVDLLHIQYIPPYFSKHFLNLNLILALKPLRKKVPVVVTFHEVFYSSSTLKEKIINSIEKSIIKRASKILVHTNKQKEYLRDRFKRKNIETVFMGLNPKKMHLKKHKNLLFFGLISHNKGIHVLLKAMAQLKDYNLLVAGRLGDDINKSYLAKLKKLKQDLNLKNVKMEIGWISDERMHQLFEESDLLIMPYLWAPYQSAVLHDAFSYGLPVVITDAGCVHEVVEDFESGIIIKPNSTESLIAGIKKANKNYDKLQSGILDYRRKASWESVSKKFIKIYSELV